MSELSKSYTSTPINASKNYGPAQINPITGLPYTSSMGLGTIGLGTQSVQPTQPTQPVQAVQQTPVNSSLANSVFGEQYGKGFNAGINNNVQPQGTNALGWANSAIGLGGLAANVYYAEQNKRAQEDARDYARSRDMLADAKTNTFQRNLV